MVSNNPPLLVVDVTKPEDLVRNYMPHSGHRFCKKHKRLPREYQLAEGYKEIPEREVVYANE